MSKRNESIFKLALLAAPAIALGLASTSAHSAKLEVDGKTRLVYEINPQDTSEWQLGSDEASIGATYVISDSERAQIAATLKVDFARAYNNYLVTDGEGNSAEFDWEKFISEANFKITLKNGIPTLFIIGQQDIPLKPEYAANLPSGNFGGLTWEQDAARGVTALSMSITTKIVDSINLALFNNQQGEFDVNSDYSSAVLSISEYLLTDDKLRIDASAAVLRNGPGADDSKQLSVGFVYAIAENTTMWASYTKYIDDVDLGDADSVAVGVNVGPWGAALETLKNDHADNKGRDSQIRGGRKWNVGQALGTHDMYLGAEAVFYDHDSNPDRKFGVRGSFEMPLGAQGSKSSMCEGNPIIQGLIKRGIKVEGCRGK